jgi:hypothetical protein
MKPILYRGFEITPMNLYVGNDKADFYYERDSDAEDSGFVLLKRLSEVKEMIDLRLEERPEVYEVEVYNFQKPVRLFDLFEALAFTHTHNGRLINNFLNP